MGILANSVSLCQFQVLLDNPPDDLFAWASEQLATKAFRSIDRGSEELSVGWVLVDDPQSSDFSEPRAFCRDHYLVFSLRRDQRRIPSALLKAHQERIEAEFLAAHPGLNRVPKQKREELRDAVRGTLLSQTLPVPAVFDVVWDTRTGRLGFANLNAKVLEMFEGLFRQTFEGSRLIAVHPYGRAEGLLDKAGRAALAAENCAGGDSVLEMIEGNRWLGEDFLRWLLYQTLTESSRYTVNGPGPATVGEGFVAYLNDRLLLKGGNETGVQKVTVVGPQDAFSEVRTALNGGKQITEAIVHLEKLEDQWKLTLKGETFHFASFKTPSVKVEKDQITDAASEKEAVFYEKMHVMEEGLQLFDSLYRHFLDLRLGADWPAVNARIAEWLAAE